jgi:hypothetical protein
LTLLLILGCGPAGPEPAEDYLIRLGKTKVTGHDFMQAFELVKTAHPGSVDSDSPGLQEARQQLLDEMTIDLILLKHSNELGIAVSQAELDAAVAAVKADYPPGIFEQTLIESALPFDTWKRRLRSRLLMEKLVEVELRPYVTITADDITTYYEQNYGGKAVGAESEQQFDRLKEILVADLQRAKTEKAFSAWIDSLRSKYPVEVNERSWSRIAESEPQKPSLPIDGAGPGK